MDVGRFIVGIAALLWSPRYNKYLLLKRSPEKDFGANTWECITGRLNQGEWFEEAVHREVYEELRAKVQIDFIIGTSHLYRGEKRLENEMVMVNYCCTISNPDTIQLSSEHSEHRWVTAEEAYNLLSESGSATKWLKQSIERAETVKSIISPELQYYYRTTGFELE